MAQLKKKKKVTLCCLDGNFWKKNVEKINSVRMIVNMFIYFFYLLFSQMFLFCFCIFLSINTVDLFWDTHTDSLRYVPHKTRAKTSFAVFCTCGLVFPLQSCLL